MRSQQLLSITSLKTPLNQAAFCATKTCNVLVRAPCNEQMTPIFISCLGHQEINPLGSASVELGSARFITIMSACQGAEMMVIACSLSKHGTRRTPDQFLSRIPGSGPMIAFVCYQVVKPRAYCRCIRRLKFRKYMLASLTKSEAYGEST